MNNDIANFYLAQINKGQINRALVREALFVGIRSSNALLVRKSLNLLQPPLNWKRKDRFHIANLVQNEFASKEVIELLVEKGIAFDGPHRTLIFSLSPKQLLDFYNENMECNGTSLQTLVYHVHHFFIRAIRSKYSIFSIPFRVYEEDDFKPSFFAYLDDWCHKLITLIKTEANDKEVEETLLNQMLEISIANPELRTTLWFSSKHEFWFDAPEEDLNKYLAMSIKYDNEEAFYDIVDNAPEETQWNIPCYPKRSQRILEKMLEMGILVPGTDNAFEAFCDYIKTGKVSRKTLRMIMHPDYSKKTDFLGRTPLWLAIDNRDFPIELYPMLITDKQDLEIKDKEGRTAIFGTTSTEHPQHGIWMLTQMGANPFARDNNGDNILHVLAKKDPGTLKAVVPILPPILLGGKNKDGLTPIEVVRQDLLNYYRETGEANGET